MLGLLCATYIYTESPWKTRKSLSNITEFSYNSYNCLFIGNGIFHAFELSLKVITEGGNEVHWFNGPPEMPVAHNGVPTLRSSVCAFYPTSC